MVRTKLLCVAWLIAACGSSGSHPDGGHPVCTGADRDGDGVCDDVDDCPDVADPGQVDLDGDGAGWVCDPIESLTVVPGDQGLLSAAAAVHGNSLAAVLHLGCTNNVCEDEFVVATPAGGGTTRTDAMGWAYGASLGTPLISADGQIFLDVSTMGTTVFAGYDASAGDLHGHTFGYVNEYGLDGDSFAMAALDHGDGNSEIVIPNGPDVVSIATGTQLPTANRGVELEQSSPPTTFAIESQPRTEYGNDVQIATYTAGNTTASMIALPPSTSAYEELDPAQTLRFAEVPLFVRTPSATKYIGVAATPTILDLPFYANSAAVDHVTNSTLFLTGQLPDNKFAVGAITHGQFVPIASEIAQSGPIEVFGGALPVVRQFVSQGQNNQWNAWVLGSSGAVQLAAPLGNPAVSTYGSTAHVVGLATGTNGFANVVLVRYRDGQPPQSITLATGVFPTTTPQVVTTAEGAAIVSGYQQAWIVPSTSLAATPVNLAYVGGGVRGTTTVIQGASTSTTQPTSQLYAYDELGGTGHLTPLTAPVANANLTLLDPPYGAPSTWFAYGAPGACNIEQVVYTGSTPSLQNAVPCDDPMYVKTWGRAPDGKLAVAALGPAAAYSVYLLGDATATKAASVVGVQGEAPAPALDTSMWPPVVVGWYGDDGQAGIACLTRHPDRCWSVPSSTASRPPVRLSVHSGGADDTDSLSLLWYPAGIDADPSHAVFLHAVGSGDLQPPM